MSTTENRYGQVVALARRDVPVRVAAQIDILDAQLRDRPAFAAASIEQLWTSAASAARLAGLYARRAGWWAVLENWVYTQPMPRLMGRAAMVARREDRAAAREWSGHAHEFAQRAARRTARAAAAELVAATLPASGGRGLPSLLEIRAVIVALYHEEGIVVGTQPGEVRVYCPFCHDLVPVDLDSPVVGPVVLDPRAIEPAELERVRQMSGGDWDADIAAAEARIPALCEIPYAAHVWQQCRPSVAACREFLDINGELSNDPWVLSIPWPTRSWKPAGVAW